ncbi:Hypp7214 [Branchiostoma lanceolatum]|uniref:Hypp7214 protein n=1 Tax=Branchiostoma lanceolatum TaxID=7740 RepID=A0A8J9YYW1_BRALA|nr:Hypp7214 [Branchiostoma lanceolatum]
MQQKCSLGAGASILGTILMTETKNATWNSPDAENKESNNKIVSEDINTLRIPPHIDLLKLAGIQAKITA